MGFKSIACHVGRFMRNHGTSIATGVAIVGYAATIVTAVQETRTFDARIEELRISNNGAELTKKEIATTAVKTYWPTAVIFAISTTSLIMGQRAMYKRLTNLTAAYNTTSTAYAMTEKAFKEYKKQVGKVLTDKKQEEVANNEAKEIARSVTSSAIESAERIPTASSNVQLCMERWTRRLFYADPLELKEGFVRFMERYNDDEIVSLNDLFNEWGLSTYDSNIGEAGIGARLGWKRDVVGSGLKLDIRATVSSDETKSIYVIGTNIFPEYDFDAFNGY